MAFGGYGHYFQAMPNIGITFGRLSLQGGYMFIDTDIHENRSAGTPAGIAPQITGPDFGLQFRLGHR